MPKLEVVNTRNPQVIRLAFIGIVLLVFIALVGILSGFKGSKKTPVADNSLDAVLNPGQSNLVGSTDAGSGSLGTPTFPPSGSSNPLTSSTTPSPTGLSTGPATLTTPTFPDRGLLDPGHALTSPTDASRPPSRPPSSGTSGNSNDSASSKTYVVQSGDTLWAIAQKVYGDGSKYKQLVKDNPGIAVGKLQAGTKLKLSSSPSSSATTAKPTTIRGKTVIVREGQTLRSIAKREYGNPGLWELIYKANKSKIKNPSELPVGTTLIIPPKP